MNKIPWYKDWRWDEDQLHQLAIELMSAIWLFPLLMVMIDLCRIFSAW